MKQRPHKPQPQEIELKLSLPGADPSTLAKRLARTPVLARRKASKQSLHNIYYDTPDQQLRQQRVALRLRRIGGASQPRWLQTLKTSMGRESALSRRGEWESPVPDASLSRQALEATAWPDIDHDGRLFAALAPCFVTVFERTLWLVRRRDGTVIEVALDLGHIEADGQRAPLCELELELKAGQPSALFDLARELARTLAVLPAHLSKAERGYRLAQESNDMLPAAQSPSLSPDVTLPELAQQLLRDMFLQFTSNLSTLQTSDDPELVHQARVAWRRFKSGLKLFSKLLAGHAPPSLEHLQPLLSGLSQQRNLDVARLETLPPLSAAYAMGDAQRAQSWQDLMMALTQAGERQRQALRQTLQAPPLGACLLIISQWLEQLAAHSENRHVRKGALRQWARQRVLRLEKQLERAQKDANTAEDWHRVRILAKRLRYGTQALRELLPSRLARRCYSQATELQTDIGATRDIAHALVLVAELAPGSGLLEFLRGVAAGLSSDDALTGMSPH